MLGWVASFLVLAAVAGYLGFFTLLGAAAVFAKIFMGVFLALLVVSGAMSVLRRTED